MYNTYTQTHKHMAPNIWSCCYAIGWLLVFNCDDQVVPVRIHNGIYVLVIGTYVPIY